MLSTNVSSNLIVPEFVKPRIVLNKTLGRYSYKTITEPSELIEALRLRYKTFHVEMQGKNDLGQLDIDEYDQFCDHLIIVENSSQKIVGTYRLNCTEFSDTFYSENEFYIAEILKRPHNKLELGRACIDKNHRTGSVILMLWRGIAQYMKATDSRILFGCASVQTEEPIEAALVYDYFKQNNFLDPQFNTEPSLDYKMAGIHNYISDSKNILSAQQIEQAQALLPGLINSYLSFGCRIAGLPAHDKAYKCIDFLTILELSNVNNRLWEKLTQ